MSMNVYDGGLPPKYITTREIQISDNQVDNFRIVIYTTGNLLKIAGFQNDRKKAFLADGCGESQP